MVDFQSRDTSRGYGDDEDDEDESAEGTDEQGDTAEQAAAGEQGDAAEQAETGEQGESTEQEVDGVESGGSTADDAAADTAVEDAGIDDSPTAPESGDLAGEGAEAERSGVEDSAATASDSDPLAPSDGGNGAEPGAAARVESGTDPLAPDPDTSTESGDDGDADPLADAGETASKSASAASGGSAAERSESVETDEGRGRADHAAKHDPGQAHTAEHARAEDDGHGHAQQAGTHDAQQAGAHDHEHTHAADIDLLGVAVVTVSSTRTREDDPSGDVVEAAIEATDHEVVTREILRDDLDGVQNALLHLTGRDDVDVVVTTGGTGVTPDDVTVEAARPLFDRELPGFGELFRIFSYEEVGTRAIASRATAGMVEGVAVFCLPGSEAAARLGTEELIVEEMEHLVSLARRDD